jgi:hypothetical protein
MSPQSQLCPDIVLSDSRAVSQRVIKLKCLCIFPGGRSGRGVMSHSFQMGNMAIIATAGSKTEFWTVYHQAAQPAQKATEVLAFSTPLLFYFDKRALLRRKICPCICPVPSFKQT